MRAKAVVETMQFKGNTVTPVTETKLFWGLIGGPMNADLGWRPKIENYKLSRTQKTLS